MSTAQELRSHGAPPRIVSVGKKKNGPNNRQVNVRLTEEDYARIEAVSLTLGIDVAQLVRSCVKKQLPHLEREAEEIRRDETREGE